MTGPDRSLRWTALAVLASLLCARPAFGAVLEIPLALDYRLLEQTLATQVFTGPDQSAVVFADSIRCNTLVLSDPRVEGAEGHVKVRTSMLARTGSPIGGKCRFARSWRGLVETVQTAHVDPDSLTVTFRVTDSRLLRGEDGRDVLPRFMRRWIRDYVHPRLGGVSIDLGPALTGMQQLLDAAIVMPEPAPGSGPPGASAALTLADVRPSPRALVAVLSLDVPDAPSGAAPPVAAPLTDEELARWDAAWQSWDAFATWMIKTLAASADPELTRALAETLLEARYELRDALARDDRQRDPVRALFLRSWERLAPLLHASALPVPGAQALSYAAFVSAGDALQALDQLAPHVGLRLDRDSLRSLARVLLPAVTAEELHYGTQVDPQLRALLGLDPELRDETPSLSILEWLIPSAHAATLDPALVRRLNAWVAERSEVDEYLEAMARLLDAIADAERVRSKVPAEFRGVYDPLLRATAWQESCWRQYVERDGKIETIRSAAGSAGLMQVNVHVWRGIYDIDRILGDVGYNARAGNEILVHYLVDYAIRKNEHAASGDPDDLARAAYAMYNGGPRHMSRYRDPATSATLKKIDNAFWVKYQAIRSEGPMAVKRCLAG